jgi:hypothetical protein
MHSWNEALTVDRPSQRSLPGRVALGEPRGQAVEQLSHGGAELPPAGQEASENVWLRMRTLPELVEARARSSTTWARSTASWASGLAG